MTIRDFFRLFIKSFALITLILSLFSGLSSSPMLYYFAQEPQYIFIMLIGVVAILAFYVFLIKQTDRVIDFLELDKNFDAPLFDLGGIQKEDLVKIAITFFGLYLLIGYAPDLIRDLYKAILTKKINGMNYEDTTMNWMVDALNMITGYVLITNI